MEGIVLDRKAHWERVYRSKGEAEVSWYQQDPRLSLDLIESVAPHGHGRIVDIGGGASVLVDRLLELSFERIAVLDVSEAALDRARSRLGERAGRVEWIVADVTESPELNAFDVWHDRAVFHFLTDAEDRRKYVELARTTVPEGGHLIVATFAEGGPKRCSDLEVCRYDARSLAAELGEGFVLVRDAAEFHTTPGGSMQEFTYGVFRRAGEAA